MNLTIRAKLTFTASKMSPDSRSRFQRGHHATMRRDLEHLTAWTFEDAARRTLAPGIFREYKRAEKEWDDFRPNPAFDYSGLRLNGRSGHVDYRFKRISERWDAATRHRNEGMIKPFALGKLVTYGREEKFSPQLKLVPASAWRDMGINDWKNCRAATRRPRVIIHDVRIYPVLEAPNAIDHLTGLKLGAAISDLIFSDPLIDALRCRSGGKTLELDKRRSDLHFLWPLVQPIENRRRGLSTASRLANSILGLRVVQLVGYLSTAQVMAVETANGVGEIMPPAVWTEVGAYLDLNSGAIYRLPDGVKNAKINSIQPLFNDLILSRPDQISPFFHVKPMVPDDVRPSTTKVKPIPKASITVEMRERLQKECSVLLKRVIGASSNKRTHSRKQLFDMAYAEWPALSERAFDQVRRAVIKELNANAWFESGAPEKS
jgi:hypothetical protein